MLFLNVQYRWSHYDTPVSIEYCRTVDYSQYVAYDWRYGVKLKYHWNNFNGLAEII